MDEEIKKHLLAPADKKKGRKKRINLTSRYCHSDVSKAGTVIACTVVPGYIYQAAASFHAAGVLSRTSGLGPGTEVSPSECERVNARQCSARAYILILGESRTLNGIVFF